ncbi:MAG: DoxX family protein [Steroidobacteraceae bacterium]|jgi:putative oxidoreductase|nr:DoxX family protein [Steroidobacteraceae bacterium]
MTLSDPVTPGAPPGPARLAPRVSRLADPAILRGVLDALQPWLLAASRGYVAWQFLKSGWLKLGSWETTLGLFRDEYRVPLLPPDLAAVAGTAGEIVFPLLLIAGLASRLAALGLSAVNALAVLSYAHVLLAEGFEAALGQHLLWGYMLAVLAVCGPGALALDARHTRRGAGR